MMRSAASQSSRRQCHTAISAAQLSLALLLISAQSGHCQSQPDTLPAPAPTATAVPLVDIFSSARPKFDPRNCTLAVSPLEGSHWEYENCVYIGQGGGFILHWTFDRASGLLDMAIAGFWEGWIGWGIGVRMIGASAIVLVPGGGGFFVSRYHLTSYKQADIMPDTGDLVLANNSIKVHREGNRLRLFFAVVLPPTTGAGIYCVMAKGPGGDDSGNLEQHDPKLTARTYIRLDAGAPPTWLQSTHGVVNMLTWGLLLPIGVLVARHLRSVDAETGAWLNAHRAIQAAGYFMGAFGFLLGVVMWAHGHKGRTRVRGVPLEDTDKGLYDPTGHRVVGILMFLLASFQITAIMAHPHKDALLRPWWDFIHHWTGRLIVLLSITNVWLGISLIEPHTVAWGYAYGVLLGVLVIVALVLEGFLFWKWLMDESPSTPLQRILRSALPRSIRYNYRMGIEESAKLDLTDGDIEFMATRIRQDLDSKHI